MARIVVIQTAPDMGEPMVSHQSIRAIAGLGLDGDRYTLQKGAWKAKGERTHKKKRNLTIMSFGGIRLANTLQGVKEPFTPAETRRNVIIDGLDANVLIGKEFLLGTVRCRGVEYSEPCDRPSTLCGKAWFKEAFHGNGGVNCEILTDGIISIDDELGFPLY